MRKRSIAQLLRLVCACLLLFGVEALVSSVQAQAQTQDEGQNSRQIFAEEFTRARPEKRKTTSSTGSKPHAGGASASAKKRPRYKRVPPAPSDNASTAPSNTSSTAATASEIPTSAAKVGITIWRLRPAKPSDGGARILVQENAKETEWTPERVAATTELRVNDRVRLSIEVPREGYLYVIDREQYADGSMGEPYLIFPTLRTNGGDNQVRPGKLIDIPAQADNPNYFTLIPSPSREDQVAEVLSVIVTTQPMENLQLTDKPLKLTKSQVEKWEKEWGARVEKFELEGGAGQTWSKEEKEASSEGTGRYLVQEDPSPQTVYLVEGKNNKGLLVTVPLRYRR